MLAFDDGAIARVLIAATRFEDVAARVAAQRQESASRINKQSK
jgi:hypothetical protein